MSRIDQHRRQADRYLANAEKLFARGRLEKASEMYWGAASQALKAVAQKRGWRHGSHGLLRDCAGRLADESAEERIEHAWDAAEVLHQNFYELNGSRKWVRRRARRVRWLVQRLARL